MAPPDAEDRGRDKGRRSHRDVALPCLLDRVQSRGDVSIRAYRQAVLQDLEVLLNTPAMFQEADEHKWPRVVNSVLNLGTPDLVGTTLSSISLIEIERRMLQAIRRFEPRIVSGSLSLRASRDETSAGNALIVEISGELWVGPVSEPLFVRTMFDLETGRCVIGKSQQSTERADA